MAQASTTRSLVEVFGFSPTDITPNARKFWQLNACPFIGKACSKYDHTNTICYGTCSVTNNGQNVVICPNRLYADGYATIKRVSTEVFGDVQFMLFDEYIKEATKPEASLACVVALGQNSGKEVKLSKMSMDWVLAHIVDGALVGYVGIEVQSIDITGNYRDAWYAARDQKSSIPPSEHGLNWANVHKRLIPQIIRKSLVYSKSSLVTQGLYFIVPEPVYQRFEEIIGDDIPLIEENGKDIITVHTYDLGPTSALGTTRTLTETRKLKFKLDEFSARFISGPNLPSGESLDNKIRDILFCK
ncbi:NotI family restriction endonuclease [Chitinibacter tainanensis]|uniref:NotI family restriction endonuclease n=1 Tax=Chitinibacter tainanensis TaxID=230667 RepID=UPI0023550808|nr:NotI family restriction endonuclease [Chitinibacter tainanensis]